NAVGEARTGTLLHDDQASPRAPPEGLLRLRPLRPTGRGDAGDRPPRTGGVSACPRGGSPPVARPAAAAGGVRRRREDAVCSPAVSGRLPRPPRSVEEAEGCASRAVRRSCATSWPEPSKATLPRSPACAGCCDPAARSGGGTATSDGWPRRT